MRPRKRTSGSGRSPAALGGRIRNFRPLPYPSRPTPRTRVVLAVEDANTTEAKSGDATLTGVGTLASTGAKAGRGTSTVTGAGTLASTGRKNAAGTTTATGAGSAASTGATGRYGASSVTGTGTLTSTGQENSRTDATLAGAGALESTGTKSGVGTAQVTGAGVLTSTGSGSGGVPVVVPPYGGGAFRQPLFTPAPRPATAKPRHAAGRGRITGRAWAWSTGYATHTTRDRQRLEDDLLLLVDA